MSLWNKAFKPMLLKEIPKPFSDKNYIYEIKFDGIRALIYATPKQVKILTRNEKDITFLYPELTSIKSIVKGKVIFDGEIICTENGYPSFAKLQERSHLKTLNKITKQMDINPVTYMCFDILYENKDLINTDLMTRKKFLNKYINTDYFVKTKFIYELGEKLFKQIKQMGLEGIVAKEKNSKYYINSRNDVWLKIKNFKEKTFFIGGYIYNDGYVFSVLLGEYVNKEFIFVGKVFIAKKDQLFSKLNHEHKTKSMFKDYNEESYTYIKPKYKCKVKYMERTKNKHLRQPFYIGVENEIK